MWLVLIIPRVKESQIALGTSEANSVVLSLPWSWCIPIGVLLATGLMAKDYWYRPAVAGMINLLVFWTILLLWGACASVICLRFVVYP
jgi:hypothetical protein